MDDLEVRRANVIDAAQLVFDAHRHTEVVDDIATVADDLLVLAEALPRRGLGRCLAVLRRSANGCRSEANRAATAAARMNRLLADYVAHSGRPAATSPAIHRRFDRARAGHERAISQVLDRAAWTGRLAAGLAALHVPDVGQDPLWDAAVRFLARLPLPTSTCSIKVPDSATVEVYLTGLAAHVGQHVPRFAIIEVEGSDRFVQFKIGETDSQIESTGDQFLRSGRRLSKSDIALLEERRFEPPDDTCPNWHLDLGSGPMSASRVGPMAAELLCEVHRFDPTTSALVVTIDEPLTPWVDEATGPGGPALVGDTIEELGVALVERIEAAVDESVAEAWVTVTQFGDHAGWSGHLRLDHGEMVSAELHASADLTPTQRRRLWDARWQSVTVDDPVPVVCRRELVGVTITEACHDLVRVMAEVLDLDPAHDVAGVVVTYP